MDMAQGLVTGNRGRKILVVEDSGLVALEIEMALIEAGFDVISVDSVASATALVDATRFSAAVLDVFLPDGNCASVAQRLTENGTAVALVSGGDRTQIGDVLPGFTFFPKPVATADLTAWLISQIVAEVA